MADFYIRVYPLYRFQVCLFCFIWGQGIMEKKTDWKGIFEWFGHYLFDNSLLRALNSIILVYLLVIFLKFFIVGVHANLLTDYFQIVMLFGLTIILFSVVPLMLAGWGGIMNCIILFFGVLYIADVSSTFFFPSIKLVIFFAILHYCWKIYLHVEEKRKEKVRMEVIHAKRKRKKSN